MLYSRYCYIQENDIFKIMFCSRKCNIQENVIFKIMLYSRKCHIRENVLLNKMLYATRCLYQQDKLPHPPPINNTGEGRRYPPPSSPPFTRSISSRLLHLASPCLASPHPTSYHVFLFGSGQWFFLPPSSM